MVRSKENEDSEGRKVEDEPDDLTIVRQGKNANRRE